MTQGTPASHFAPAERVTPRILRRQSRLLESMPLLRQLYDAVTDIVLVLNQQRQIVFCNRRMADVLGVEDRTELYGLRPGEALRCSMSCQAAGGCGTPQSCGTCGAINAILTSQSGQGDVRECRILRKGDGEALDLLVRTTPLALGGEQFTIFAATDISHEKRRRALERTFFHDLMNTAIGLKFFTRKLAGAPPEQAQEGADRMHDMVDRLLEEIREQRDLAAAENRDLAARPAGIGVAPFLDGLLRLYRQLADQRGCRLVVAPEAQDVRLKSDPVLLSRVLGNMIKNALEASQAGQTVTVGYAQANGRVEFRVHNESAMPPEVQHQVFHRSFSTKGAGRGLGTYSMKLLGERYLKGSISFCSSPAHGTTFTASFPPDIDAE